MKNWLTKAIDEPGMTPTEAASAIRAWDDEVACFMEHPGMLTLNDVGAICRAMPAEHARRMLGRIVEVFAL